MTYQEEEQIKEKTAQLKSQGVIARSVRSLIGLNVPMTLKDRLAQSNNPDAKDALPPKDKQAAQPANSSALS